jgi:PDZ domain-containing protein
MPTPYMINQPGLAEEIKPMVSIPAADKEEKGIFMLTTVSVSYANLAMLATAQFNRNAEIVRKEPDRNEEEYETQQRYYMSSSQSNAIMAAYHLAHIDYDIVPEYVFIVGLFKAVTPKGEFHPGDIIRKVDGKPIGKFEDLSALLAEKKPGDQVSVQLERKNKDLDERVELINISTDKKVVKAGLGVSIGEVRKVEPAVEDQEVKFVDTRIGGPSAGLMFTLEIYNQLTPGDLSKGYRIAGTGTIDEDGTVGEIGGVQFKIVAAERQHADIFFVPVNNYNVAKAKADQIGSKMKLVKVQTAQEALEYLQQLEPKT